MVKTTSTFLAIAWFAFTASSQANDFYVAPNGDDAHIGTAGAPFRTIQRAADAAQPGDSVLVAPGIYRERISPARGGLPDRPIVYRSVTPHGAIVRGAVEWKPDWHQDAPEIWSGMIDPKLFPDDSHRDGANPFAIPLSSTPGGRNGQPEFERGYPDSNRAMVYGLGQVIVDGQLYDQEPAVEEMQRNAGSWFYRPTEGRLSIHFKGAKEPTKHAVEISNQRRLFAPHQRGLGYIWIEGFVFEYCGNQYPTNFWEAQHPEWQQAGAVGTRSGHHWSIRNNVIRFANGVGLDLGNEGDPDVDLERGNNGRALGAAFHLVENNEIVENGAAGTASYYGTDLVIRGNIVERNNQLRFTGKKRWESAGIKLHRPDRSLIEHNLVRDNYGKWGIWLDQGAGKETRVLANVIIHHGVGLDYEIGHGEPSVAANNILIDNDVGISTRESGGVTMMNNLLLGSKTVGIRYSIDHTRGGDWTAMNNALFNNLFIGGGLFVELTAPDDTRSGGRKLDNNVYVMKSSDLKLAFRQHSAVSLEDWQKEWNRYNGNDNADGHSVAFPGSTYAFHPDTFQLDLNITFDPAAIDTQRDSRVTTDFQGKSSEATWIVGPFQTLRRGSNQFQIWYALARQ